MTKYKAYPEYKDSGVEWLGNVPAEWLITELKRYSWVKGGYAFPSDSFISFGEPVIRIGDISQDGSINLENCKYVSHALAKQSRSYTVRNGELLMAMTGATIGKAGFYECEFPALINQRVGLFKVLDNLMHYRFLWYILKSYGYQEYIKLTAFGGAQPNISDVGMVGYRTTVPSLQEQSRIASFLDHETAKIDNLIEKQQQLIELLKEKRQAVISHAVTKGLNPDVPMKDSGVEWLGEVPEHWDVKKFKFACVDIIAGPFGSSITKDMYVNDGYKVYGQEQVIPNDFNVGDYFISPEDFNKLSRYEVNAGDILISCVGTFGKIAVFPNWAKAGIINPRLIKATLSSRMNPFFIREFLKSTTVSKQFELLSRGGTMGVINISILNEIIVSIPPLEEQDSIYEFIYSQKKKLIDLIDLANSQINLLQERRTALISAAVTGKIDVRDWVAPNTQYVEESQEVTA